MVQPPKPQQQTEWIIPEPDHADLEREAAENVYSREWGDMEFEVYEMGINGSDHARRMEKLNRLKEISGLIAEEAERRAREAGVRRFREEVAELIRGEVADETVAAWLESNAGVRGRMVVVRALRSVMLPEREFAVLLKAGGGDDWLDNKLKRCRADAAERIERYDIEIGRKAEARLRLIEYLERCQ